MDKESEESRKEHTLTMDVDPEPTIPPELKPSKPQPNEMDNLSMQLAAPDSVNKEFVSQDLDKVLEDYIEAIGKEKVSNSEDASFFKNLLMDNARDPLKGDTWTTDVTPEPTSSPKHEPPKLQHIHTDFLPPKQCDANEKKKVTNEANNMVDFDRYLEDYIEAVRQEKDSGTENEMSFIRELIMEEGFEESKKERSHTVVSSDDFKMIEDKKQMKPFNCLEGRAGSSNDMINNGKSQTGEKSLKCDKCNKKFTYKSHLQVHVRTHTGEKPYKCEVCKVKFSHRNSLNRHVRTHTGEKPYECDVCNKKFNQLSTLKNHVRTHTGEKPYKCEVCKVKFSRRFSLNCHVKTHTREMPYECDVCNKKFTQQGHLKIHSRTHSGEKPYECEVCKAKFSRKYGLQLHMRTHSGEKLYECDVCKKKFTQQGHLKIHSRTHSGEKPYECEVCKVKFSHRNSLNRHVRTHTGEKPYECDICKEKFRNSASLKYHKKRTHGEKL